MLSECVYRVPLTTRGGFIGNGAASASTSIRAGKRKTNSRIHLTTCAATTPPGSGNSDTAAALTGSSVSIVTIAARTAAARSRVLKITRILRTVLGIRGSTGLLHARQHAYGLHGLLY